jgi:hypothetical protein
METSSSGPDEGGHGFVGERAEILVGEIARRVDLDQLGIREEIRRRLLEPSEEYVWARGDRIVGEALRSRWQAGLEESCRRALGEVQELYAFEARRCLELGGELEEHGADSWVAAGVLYRLGFDLLFDVLAEDDDAGLPDSFS